MGHREPPCDPTIPTTDEGCSGTPTRSVCRFGFVQVGQRLPRSSRLQFEMTRADNAPLGEWADSVVSKDHSCETALTELSAKSRPSDYRCRCPRGMCRKGYLSARGLQLELSSAEPKR